MAWECGKIPEIGVMGLMFLTHKLVSESRGSFPDVEPILCHCMGEVPALLYSLSVSAVIKIPKCSFIMDLEPKIFTSKWNHFVINC